MKKIPIVACILALAILFGCKREERRFREPTPSSTASNAITMSGLHPANPTQGTVPPDWPVNNAYEESADAVSQGQKLYDQYNCSGCHAHGGGGIGPPLMDNKLIYGSEPQNIFFTIIQGRPNGMPSFRNRVPEYQAWQIAAYVRSMSGLLPSDVAPARSDELYMRPPEQSMPKQAPTGVTGQAEKTQ